MPIYIILKLWLKILSYCDFPFDNANFDLQKHSGL